MTSLSGYRLIDYFVISGLDVKCGLEPDQLSGDSLHCAPLERPYKARLLSHFPKSVPWNKFDKDSVCMLCHPKGTRFLTQRSPRAPVFHSFLITREDGSRTYGAALTFYEQVEDKEICLAMQTLQSMHQAELSNAQSRTLYSHLGSTVHDRSPKHCTSTTPDTESYSSKVDQLYVTKCLSVLSPLALVSTFEQILSGLYSLIMESGDLELPMESYIYNMLYEIPLPHPGRSIKLTTATHNIICQRPGATEFPLMDYPLREVFQLLGIDNVLNIFSSILLEHQTLLYSEDYQKLMLVAESLTGLIFPFAWQHVYVPILPASLTHFLDAPVPFIMGLHHSADGQALSEQCAQANMCFVDIDKGHVELPEFLPMFPYRQDIREDLLLHLTQQRTKLHMNGHLKCERDSGFRDSFAGFDSEYNHEQESESSSTWSLSSKMEILQQSEAMAKITALAKKSGVISSLDDISETLGDGPPTTTKSRSRVKLDKHHLDLIYNNSVREIFLHYFLQVFSTFESFVIQPSQDMDQWLTNRDTMQNFDKAAFLSDQPDAHLQFLSQFIESQMFTCFIDNKIISQWEEQDANLKLFELRLQSYKELHGEQRTTRHPKHSHVRDAEIVIERRSTTVDLVAPAPHKLESTTNQTSNVTPYPHRPGFFPRLHKSLLKASAATQPQPAGKKEGLKWRKKERTLQHSEHLQLNSDQREKMNIPSGLCVKDRIQVFQKYIQEARSKSLRQPKLTDLDPAAMVQTNWKFVETLLKECKTKTKRMLVKKMGQEAVDLGHVNDGGGGAITGVEENTLIASMCDLLERIWSHGIQSKKGKSALWSHLLSFQEAEESQLDSSKPSDPNLLSPGLSWSVFKKRYDHLGGIDDCMSGTQTWPIRRHRKKPSRTGLEMLEFKPLPNTVLFDMRNVLQMSDIRTEVGYARAWVRLSLEKKLLSRHLKELVSNTDVLKTLYKRYAFLRCEDEREQFLYHLLSLNAVDYYCFTNTFKNTMIPYRVLIFQRQQKPGGGSTSANCWFSLSGHLNESEHISVPKHTLDIEFKKKSLGILTTMRIGHDNAGISPRWLVEHVLVRNEITGQTYRFPCGRWLGRSIDDGSIERLLVAEIVPSTTDHAALIEKCRTPPRCRSPSLPRRGNESKMLIPGIQQILSDSINNLVKYFYKPEKERGSLTSLLCGEYGLVYCLEHVFQCGFKSSRLFRNRFYIWDFIEKVQSYYIGVLQSEQNVEIRSDIRAELTQFCHVVECIDNSLHTVGKDGRFQVFVCIGIRDKVLHRWVHMISRTPVTETMYEESSFMRDTGLVKSVTHLLYSLHEFKIVLEAALTKGVHI